MIIVMKRILITTLLSVSISANAQSSTELQGLLNNIKTMHANFTQSVFNENKKLLQSYTGVMEFKKPNMFRWQVEQPDASLLVTNGKKLWNYDVALEQVTIQPYTDNKEVTPLSFVLDDTSKLSKNFNIENQPGTCFKLTPKQDNSNFINVAVCFKNKQINTVQVEDHLGQTSIFEFSEVKNNDKIADAKFMFTPPAGVDVVGE